MNELQVFKNEKFGTVRTITENGKTLFCGTDVARALGYTNPQKAIRDHCKGGTKRSGVSLTTNQHGTTTEQVTEMTFIPEGDIYRLAARSKLPGADEFERWIFDEVLVSVNHTGGYLGDTAGMSDMDILARAVLIGQRQIEQKNAQIAEMKPKALFADAVSASDSSILVGELAKMLKQNGKDIGPKRLFAWLRNNGYLCKSGTQKNIPTQRSMEMGLFEIKESTHLDSNGNNIITKTPKVTGKGQLYFVNKLLDIAQ